MLDSPWVFGAQEACAGTKGQGGLSQPTIPVHTVIQTLSPINTSVHSRQRSAFKGIFHNKVICLWGARAYTKIILQAHLKL